MRQFCQLEAIGDANAPSHRAVRCIRTGPILSHAKLVQLQRCFGRIAPVRASKVMLKSCGESLADVYKVG
jgi:hypothetical protein